VEGTLQALGGAERVFLAIHFESAHFPFKSRHVHESLAPGDLYGHHTSALEVVDAQIGALMQGLKTEGYLDDALVAVVSDHGEGFNKLEATVPLLDGSGSIQVKAYGHGMNLLSNHQNKVVLSFARFIDGAPFDEAVTRSDLASLTDVKAAIDGYVSDGELTLTPAHDCLIQETGIRFASVADYLDIRPTEVMAEAVEYYEADSDGRLMLRPDRMAELNATKELGLRCQDRMTLLEYPGGNIRAFTVDKEGIPIKEVQPLEEHTRRLETYRSSLAHPVGAPQFRSSSAPI
jgi:hypothetical protein